MLGFDVGADYHLASYDESIAYFKKLGDASDRLQLVQVGETSEGQPFYLAGISSSGRCPARNDNRRETDGKPFATTLVQKNA